MKLIFLLFIALILSSIVYFISVIVIKEKKKGKRKNWKKPLVLSSAAFLLLVGLIIFGAYSTANQPDTQCSGTYSIVSPPPLVATPNGYFKLGDFYYEHGDCKKAISAYTKAIELNPNFYQAYNNRAYTNMRLRDYKDALSDLDKAIQLNPNYIQALMNRGDIHNYYYQIDRQAAITDYRKVIALTDSRTRQQTSVCGHLFLAKYNGWTLGAYLNFFTGAWKTCK